MAAASDAGPETKVPHQDRTAATHLQRDYAGDPATPLWGTMMLSVLPVAFRFARAAEEVLGGDFCRFYAQTAQLVFRESVAERHTVTDLTIPVSVDMALHRILARHNLEDRLTASHEDLAVIDLTRPSTHILLTHNLIAGIAEGIVADRIAHPNRRFLLLLSELPPPSDVKRQVLEQLNSSDTVRVLSNSGELIGTTAWSPRDREEYKKLVAEISISPIDAINRKLVRFPGHFAVKWSLGSNGCTNYFFDGRLCEHDIVELIDEFVSMYYPSVHEVGILYDSVVSTWCEVAVRAFAVRRQVSIGNVSGPNWTHVAPDAKKLLLIVPLVDTGETLRAVVQVIRSRHPTAELQVLALLATARHLRSNLDAFHESLGHNVRVHYQLTVERNTIPQSSCPSCKFSIPYTDPGNPDPFDVLSSQAFWALASDVEFEGERDVPSNRQSIGHVPQLGTLSESNRGFLAFKMHKLLRASGNMPAEPVVICPDQEGAAAIGKCLEEAFNITVIRVPKDVLKLHSEVAAPGYAWPLPTETENWAIQIRSLIRTRRRMEGISLKFGQQQPNVILMDEIIVSGDTRTQLSKFANDYGLEVLCSISAFDYSAGGDGNLCLYSVRVPWQRKTTHVD